MSEPVYSQGFLLVVDIAEEALCGRVEPLSNVELVDLLDRGLAHVCSQGPNLITRLGLSALSRLVGFGLGSPVVTNGVQSYPVVSIADLQVASMKLGNVVSPAAPALTDFQLQTTPVKFTISSITVTYPDDRSVQYAGLVPAGTLVGTAFTEEGLFLVNGALLARRTFAPSTMLPGFGKQFTHRIGPFVGSP